MDGAAIDLTVGTGVGGIGVGVLVRTGVGVDVLGSILSRVQVGVTVGNKAVAVRTGLGVWAGAGVQVGDAVAPATAAPVGKGAAVGWQALTLTSASINSSIKMSFSLPFTLCKVYPSSHQAFYAQFRRWLAEGGYSDAALNIYGGAARLALGWLDKPYWEIDPQADLDRVRAYVRAQYENEATRRGHFKGLAKLAEFLRVREHLP